VKWLTMALIRVLFQGFMDAFTAAARVVIFRRLIGITAGEKISQTVDMNLQNGIPEHESTRDMDQEASVSEAKSMYETEPPADKE